VSSQDLDPRLRDRLVTPTPARSWVIETLDRAWATPDRATSVLRDAARDARKLRSRERRALWDVVYALIRARGLLGADWPAALDRWLEGPLPDGSFAERADLPEPIAASLQRALGDQADAWLAASETRAPTVLRANRARTSAQALARRLTADGLPCRPLGGDALALEGTGNVIGHPAWQDGLFEVQDLGSQRVADFVDGADRDVLDLCAGAGGKALALAAGGARVTACDVRRRPLDELTHRARRAGARIEVVHLPDGTPTPLGARTFARVLVDAPCSGTGVWRRHPEHRWRLRDPSALDRLVQGQRALLESAFDRVAAGGMLVYATCSSLPDENEAVVDGLLADHPGWTRARPDLRTQPHVDGTDGMYAAALVRG
jgi:16S rRNA (cytosine967-C5)-methyltransferase